MPVKKFRSVEEMPSPERRQPGSPELFRAIVQTWAAASNLAPLRFPPGVYRHRTIEEMNALTEMWLNENIARLAQRRRLVTSLRA
ncbi:MAG: hypothetical protein L6R30_20600 [Thermoanaerobaculia bacterium]|nr:hypothetical protein [Thermoanaerobaculia bacterium]